MKPIDPKTFNLNSRVVVEKRKNALGLVVNRKSRIIMKDGYKFMYLDQKKIIEAYSKEVYQLKKDITNLKNYIKKYDEILKAVDTLLKKYNC